MKFSAVFVSAFLAAAPLWAADPVKDVKDKQTVNDEHGMIGAGEDLKNGAHNMNADAQWYPKAGLGLFLHWDIASTRAMNISWPMIPGRALAKKKLTETEIDRILKERDFNLDGKPPEITPNEYWSMAKDFHPTDFNPEKWCKAAKDAGFEYVVLTTKHHEGFTLWPSAYGNFGTQTYMNSKDLLKEYVDACRHNGLKVGFYFSGPDWHFDRDYMSFLYHASANPGMPSLDADLMPRTSKPDAEDVKKHQAEFAALVKGEIEELLTHYGKIDLIWFDGKPAIPNATSVVSIDEIRQWQPGIVMNGRLLGHGDFYSYERTMPKAKTAAGWAELCDPWNGAWPYTKGAYRSNTFVLGELATCRSLGINLLLGIGPMATGDLSPDAYKNMGVVAEWMKVNGASVHDVEPLAKTETASVKATAAGNMRYLYAIPEMNGTKDSDVVAPTDMQITLKGAGEPKAVTLLGDGSVLKYAYSDGTLTVDLPAAKRTKLVDVVQVELPVK